MRMLELAEFVERLARENRVWQYGHVWRRGEEHVLKRVLRLELNGPEKRGRLQKRWRKVGG